MRLSPGQSISSHKAQFHSNHGQQSKTLLDLTLHSLPFASKPSHHPHHSIKHATNLCSLNPSNTIVLAHRVLAQNGSWATQDHSPRMCSMYGICGKRKDGDVLNCPYNAPGPPPSAGLASKLQEVCPTLWAAKGPDAGYCCTEEQVDKIHSDVSFQSAVQNTFTVRMSASKFRSASAICCTCFCSLE